MTITATRPETYPTGARLEFRPHSADPRLRLLAGPVVVVGVVYMDEDEAPVYRVRPARPGVDSRTTAGVDAFSDELELITDGRAE